MARPKKLSTDIMLKIVNDYYETCGDVDLLKFSLLEAYAASLGHNVKAYDFRRDAVVRNRMDELRDLSVILTEDGVIAYKTLDVDAIINRSRNLKALKAELLELDETWRRVYDRALAIYKNNKAVSYDNQQQRLKCDELENLIDSQAGQISQLKKENKALSQTNTYQRKMIRTYLYPAIANEMLKIDNVLVQADTEVMPQAMEALVDDELPEHFSKVIANDINFSTREESLLNRMKEQALNNGDA